MQLFFLCFFFFKHLVNQSKIFFNHTHSFFPTENTQSDKVKCIVADCKWLTTIDSLLQSSDDKQQLVKTANNKDARLQGKKKMVIFSIKWQKNKIK